MRCIHHNDREAGFVCSSCGHPICRECAVDVGGRILCRTCNYNMQMGYYQNHQAQSKQGDGVNNFLFFIFLAVPGLRHMYIGVMKRGLEFLVTFFGLIGIDALIERGGSILIPLIMIIWFYSAFDSYQYRKLMAKGEDAPDKPLFSEYGFTGMRNFFGKRKVFTGVLVAALGVYLLLKEIEVYSWRSSIIPDIVAGMINFALDSIIPVLLIAGGIYIIVRVGRNKSAAE